MKKFSFIIVFVGSTIAVLAVGYYFWQASNVVEPIILQTISQMPEHDEEARRPDKPDEAAVACVQFHF